LGDRVVVLGATGYLGRVVVNALRSAGRTVVMVARRPPSFVPPGVAFIACDAGDARQLAEAVGQAAALVNAICGTPSAMVRCARNLAALAAQGAGARMVHVSSLAVFGQASGIFDETTAPVPARGHAYAAGKLACEDILRGAGAVILRPGCIYGAEAPIWCERIGRLLLAGRLGSLGHAGWGWCNVVHVDDVARSVVRALDVPAGDGGVHHVLAPDRISWNDYFGRFATQLGIAPSPIGSVKLHAEMLLVSRIVRLCRGAGPGHIITPSMARAFRCRALPVARHPLLAPHEFRSLDGGLAEAAAALHRHGAVKIDSYRLLAAAMK
jgi:nucleoside-diphosphate-sugar epimerase